MSSDLCDGVIGVEKCLRMFSGISSFFLFIVVSSEMTKSGGDRSKMPFGYSLISNGAGVCGSNEGFCLRWQQQNVCCIVFTKILSDFEDILFFAIFPPININWNLKKNTEQRNINCLLLSMSTIYNESTLCFLNWKIRKINVTEELNNHSWCMVLLET